MFYVAIAGSRAVNLPDVTAPLMQLIAGLPEEATVLLRRGASKEPEPFENLVATLCELRGLVPWFVIPELGKNRAGTYIRDVELIRLADVAIVFLDPDEDPLGDTGTAHILQKAIDADRLLYAYAVHPDGLQWIGGIDAPQRLTHLSDIMSDIRNTPLTG